MKKIIDEIRKFYYKRTNQEKYQEYKILIRNQKLLQAYQGNFKSKIDTIEKVLLEKNEINFKHSGHIGDFIYALPVIKEISKSKKCNIFIKTNHTLGNKKYFKHPSGSVMISDRIFNMALPLLKKQNYIHSIQKWDNQVIDIDLDIFREFPFSSNFHSIRWYYHITSYQPDMNLSFIDAKTSEKFKNKIVIVRTFRGRNPIIDYSFIKKYDNLLFLGIKSEYDDFVKNVPNTEFYDVNDFLELAEIMKASKFVITNQTFAFALAEGLKVPRVLEANPFIPAVFPIGNNGYDFYFQNQFENIIKKLSN